MIKGQGKLRKVGGILYDKELKESLKKLPDNENYIFQIVDDTKNRNLPSLAYLFSVVLKFISDKLPDHPSTDALYRYFEDCFAPLHTCLINGEEFEYTNLKGERQADVSDFIERVVEYAYKKWNIIVPTSEELRDPSMREAYCKAYRNQEIDWRNFISSKK